MDNGCTIMQNGSQQGEEWVKQGYFDRFLEEKGLEKLGWASGP